jgi:hypothetical protein
MSKHITISPAEAADRLAIRELVEAYAHCADRREAKGQMALFTADTHFVVYMNAEDPTPSQELHSREALAPVFADQPPRLVGPDWQQTELRGAVLREYVLEVLFVRGVPGEVNPPFRRIDQERPPERLVGIRRSSA